MNYQSMLGESFLKPLTEEGKNNMEPDFSVMGGASALMSPQDAIIAALRYQIQFLTDLFASRDAQNRAVIRQYEVQVVQQNEALVYFRALGGPAAAEGKIQ